MELNRQKKGKEVLTFEKLQTSDIEDIYYFQGEKSSAQFFLEKTGCILTGKIKINLETEAFRENDNLAFEEPVTISIYFQEQPQSMTAMYLHRDWWTRPAFITKWNQVPKRTQSIYMEKATKAEYLLPLSGNHYKTYAAPGIDDALTLIMTAYKAGMNEVDETVFLLSEGKDIYEAVDCAYKSLAEKRKLPMRSQKEYPEMFEYLGWCSWDAFYTDITEEKVRLKAEEFIQKEVPVRWFLMDDGWLSVHNQKLYSFLPEKSKFPDGFEKMIKEIKENSMVDWFGVWHAFGGYWGGIEPDSEVAYQQKEHLIETSDGKLLPYPEAEKGYGFFKDWYEILRAQGIDFVKVDGQSAIKNYYANNRAVCCAAKGAHEALEGAAAAYMGGRLINCMGMAMENILSRPGSAISRNSDDFVPDNAEGFQEHLLQNSYNALYHDELYYCDWDMFWTSHPDAEKHGILRAISGGPVYVSDRSGETEKKSLLPLIYRDGRITRMKRAAKPTLDCIFQDPLECGIVKLTNTCSYGTKREAGAVAVYNISNQTVTSKICKDEIYDLRTGPLYLFNWKDRTVVLLNEGEKEELVCEPDSCSLYLMIPKLDGVTPVGLLDKYITFHAIEEIVEDDRGHIIILREGGTFGFFADKTIKKVYVNGKQYTDRLKCENELYCLETETEGKTIITILYD